jgi:hypothetical protein
MKKLVLYLLLAFPLGLFAQTNDEAAIKAVVQRETDTWRAGDIKGHAECWHVHPYSRILVSLPDGTSIDVPPAVMLNPTPDIMGGGGNSINSNYRIGIIGDAAGSSHDQETTAKDGTKSYSYEMRMLEKINGQWKIVGESVHHYTPKTK